MQKALTAVILLFILAGVLISTKPTDQEMINETRGAGDTMAMIMRSIEVNRYTVHIEDHLFYKQAYSALDGHELALGIFGTVIIK